MEPSTISMSYGPRPDSQDAIRQAEEFFHATSSKGDCLAKFDNRMTMTVELQRRCGSLINLVDFHLSSNATMKNENISSCLRQHRQKLEDMLPPCRLMKLPAEIRDMIFAFAVTEWVVASGRGAQIGTPPRTMRVLEQSAIRIDRLNKPAPPAIILVSRQARAETLQLYYELNVFECWRPFNYWSVGWSCSTFIYWLGSLGGKIGWLRHIVLLYKSQEELAEYDIGTALRENGFDLHAQVSHRCELSEYEMSYEAMGLPRQFGRQRR
ncbi:uncharacterized protein RCC_00456 [Ramularia collo-cygni]|uniref:F-box domain-containing protein n=1 Tax=Ramularia collo-cygni TaxID=112498 RepID=A0A2D3USA1_9PEZI|nr:uncharacterized protein RCC_00456 [Ramularia collo-cygni]CZT14477.1 uncharacterized protein RCC_00456 [Ramularia collo-cygni]